MNATKLSQILAVSSLVPLILGIVLGTMSEGINWALSIGLILFAILGFSALGIYYYVNPERESRLIKERKEKVEERKKIVEAINRKSAIAHRITCSVCGLVFSEEQCPKCKTKNPKYEKNSKSEKSYAGMYALSILLGFIGGIIAWASLRNENPSVGVKCLILGIIVTIVSMGIGAVFLF